jgi:SNF2 family DNA or RNA helicase
VARDKFGNKFLDDKVYPVGKKNLDTLNQLIAPYIIRVRRSQCEGLPDREDVFQSYKLSPEQRSLYKEIVENNEYTIDGETYVVQNAAIKFNKLSQVCSGFLYYYELDAPVDKKGRPLKEHRKTHVLKKSAKLEMLSELTEDLLANEENKIIVWSNYDQEQDSIKDLLEDYGVIELRSGAGDPFEIVEKFKSDDDIRILSAKQSMGISVDISRASNAIVFSRNPNFDYDRQSRDRIDGYKQKSEKITMWYFTSANTVDEHIHKLISDKEDLDKVLTNVNMKCIGCANLIKCLNSQIEYKSPKCKFKKAKI